MTSSGEPLTQPVRLGERLRDLRKSAAVTGADLATAHGWPPSKVSKIENGRQLPTEDELIVWARHCGATDDLIDELVRERSAAASALNLWRAQARSGQAAIQRRHADAAAKATLFRNLETGYVPGLLQTPAYARARLAEALWLVRLAEDPDVLPETVAADAAAEIEAGVIERMRRQQLLYEPGRRFEFVITEAVLRQLTCPPDVMLGQLDRLMTVASGMPHVTLSILPFGHPLPLTPQHGFLLLDNETAIVEVISGELTLRGEEAAGYVRAIDALQRHAATGHAATRLIQAAGQAITTHS